MTNEPIIITPDFVWPEPDANGDRTHEGDRRATMALMEEFRRDMATIEWTTVKERRCL